MRSKRNRGILVLTTCMSLVVMSTGCRSGKSMNMFSLRGEPSPEALAGSGPTTTYPVPPSESATPEAIASVAGGTGASPTSPVTTARRPWITHRTGCWTRYQTWLHHPRIDQSVGSTSQWIPWQHASSRISSTANDSTSTGRNRPASSDCTKNHLRLSVRHEPSCAIVRSFNVHDSVFLLGTQDHTGRRDPASCHERRRLYFAI